MPDETPALTEAEIRAAGWAPGSYSFTCVDCGPQGFDKPWGDKRAVRCEACARAYAGRRALARATGETT